MLLAGVLVAGCSTEGDLPAPAIKAPVAAAPNSIFVSKGDTLYRLAQQYNVPLRDLIEANGLNPPYNLTAGQRLVLPVPRTYTVKAGDTLYGLSRQYQVDMAELVRMNNIQAPYTLKTGQNLRLPGRSPTPATVVAATPATAAGTTAKPPVQAVQAPSRKPEQPPATSLSPTERSQRPAIEVATLPPPPGQPATGSSAAAGAPVPAPTTARPPQASPQPPASSGNAAGGTRKGVEAENLPPPASSSATPSPSSSALPATNVAPAERRPAAAPPAAAPETAQTQVAAVAPPPAPVKPDVPPPRSGSRFLWPVRGTILSGFGEKPGGLRNDGINIGASKGTPVAAADAGIVAYAGNQLKSFGNLVLIRHDGGWVTVYAHLDAIGVEQGQRVTRGQGIGTVGQTGNVRAPQLHFAVRKGEQVLNPLEQLEK